MEINKLYNENCLDTMAKMPDNFIDLTVTSPPYDNLREYKGYSFDFERIAEELFRATKHGGVVVWVVGDATINGSESGTSFRQALYFKEIGFNLHDTMIYEKNSTSFPANRDGVRYTQIFEYMFVLSKGKPKCNLISDKKNRWAGFTNWGNNTQYNKKGELVKTDNIKPVQDFSPRNNIWKYSVGFNDKTPHPAVFPEQLAQDHIISWSNPNDLIYDPFTGSGTTAKMAVKLGRNWIGSEISAEYCEIAKIRITEFMKLNGTPDPTKAIHGQQINLF
jgi:site-specific DNA-methyltransferase (adenine-specific)